MGRKPHPTQILKLKGNPGKRPLNENEPQPALGFPSAPDYLDEQGKAAYARFAADLEAVGVGTKLDGPALELLAAAYAEYVAAEINVLKYGPIWMEGGKEPGKIPSFVHSPYKSVRDRAAKRVCSMLSEFGMTPSSRSKVQTDAPRKSGDKWEDLLA